MRPLLVCFLMIPVLSFSQWNKKDSVMSRVWIGAEYGGNWPQADLAERYGFMNHIGVMTGFKSSKNWFYGFSLHFISGMTFD